MEVAWQQTTMTVSEGDDGEMRQTDLCITLEDRPGIAARELRFQLTSVTGSAGEL